LSRGKNDKLVGIVPAKSWGDLGVTNLCSKKFSPSPHAYWARPRPPSTAATLAAVSLRAKSDRPPDRGGRDEAEEAGATVAIDRRSADDDDMDDDERARTRGAAEAEEGKENREVLVASIRAGARKDIIVSLDGGRGAGQ
jgi:hypothetical protein